MAPTLDIVEPLSPYDSLRILAMMLWPSDAERQRLVQITLFKALLVEREVSGTENDGIPSEEDFLDTWKKDLGGWSRIFDTPSIKDVDAQILNRRKQSAIAGHILLFIYGWAQIPPGKRGGPSVNKAIHILHTDAEQHGEKSLSRSQMMSAWQRYRSVAHYWAAQAFIDGWRASKAEWTPFEPYDINHGIPALGGRASINELRRVLYVAARLRSFGTSLEVEHSKEPLLDPHTAIDIKIPEEWKLELPTFNIPPDQLKLLKSYQAPKAI